jgi:hypothetical protein
MYVDPDRVAMESRDDGGESSGCLLWAVWSGAFGLVGFLMFYGLAFGLYQDGSVESLRTTDGTVLNMAGQALVMGIVLWAAMTKALSTRLVRLAVAVAVSLVAFGVANQIAQSPI